MPLSAFHAAETELDGLVVIDMKQISDDRGTVRELFRNSELRAAGLAVPTSWAQINVTGSARGVVRGLHGEEMTKLVTVVSGSAFGAYLDARAGSPTFGRVVTVELVPGRAVLVGPGICNGFQATGDGWTEYCYCFDREWEPVMPGVAVNPLDPCLGIPWPLPVNPGDRAQLSEKDACLPNLADARVTS